MVLGKNFGNFRLEGPPDPEGVATGPAGSVTLLFDDSGRSKGRGSVVNVLFLRGCPELRDVDVDWLLLFPLLT